MKKNKFSKTGLILVGSTIVCVLLFLAVGVPNGFFGDGGKGGNLDDENTPGIKEVINEGTPILIFDKSSEAKALMTAFDKNGIVSANILYDQNGSNEAYKTTNQDEIRAIYKAMKNLVVVDKTDKSITDCYHHVYFTLKDGSKYGYRFEGENILCMKESNYQVYGGEDLWSIAKKKCGAN